MTAAAPRQPDGGRDRNGLLDHDAGMGAARNQCYVAAMPVRLPMHALKCPAGLAALGALALALFIDASTFAADTVAPTPMLPTQFKWSGPPNNPALQAAWVVGNEQTAGGYVLRVRLAADGRIAPHTHPDQRNSTVLTGTLYVGFGETFDEARVVAIPAGGVYVAPAQVPHYVWAKDGAVEYQEVGSGPTATVPLAR